jgi:hypothetical protein
MCRLLCLKAEGTKGLERELNLSNQLRLFWDRYRGAQGVWRELLTVALALGTGLVVMPCLIYAAGRLVLGAYSHGGIFALWRDFLAALATGSAAAWFVVLGPYLFVWLLRGGRRLLHN